MSTQPVLSTRPAPRRRRRAVVAAAAIVTLSGAMTLTACGTDDEAGGSSGSNGDTSTSAQTGTRANPVPAGTSAEVGDWTITLAPTTLDAADVVLAENSYNDPPEEGRQFIMTEVSFAYDGEDSATPWVSLSIKFVGSDGNTYSSGTDDGCGVIPSPRLMDVGEMYAGASSAANVCLSVPTAAIDGGSWSVEESFSFSSKPVFFALS
ncbi:MAG: hypothetical protein FWD18_07155 [Micrococcales bacterium]|nr:hypothetical protein [Micrococcales bacterium]